MVDVNIYKEQASYQASIKTEKGDWFVTKSGEIIGPFIDGKRRQIDNKDLYLYAKNKHEELKRKRWSWRSFWNGVLEGVYYMMHVYEEGEYDS